MDWLQDLYVAEMPNFIDRNFDSPLDLLRDPAVAAKLVRLGGFGRLGNAIQRRFRDERLHRMFSFQAMYAGLAPDEALAIYAVITYMDSIEGVWFPDGGMHAMPVALATAAEKAGTEFRYGASVAEVLRRTDTGGVAGVRLDSGEQLAADAVVCTLDLPTAYEQLLPDLTRRGRCATAVLTVGRGLARRRPGAAGARRRPTTTSTSAPSGAAPSTTC